MSRVGVLFVGSLVSATLVGCVSRRVDGALHGQATVLHQAAFGQILADDSVGRMQVKGYCIGIRSAQGVVDPSEDVLRALRDHTPPVWTWSACGPEFGWTGVEVHDTAAIVLKEPQLEADGQKAYIEGWYSTGATHGLRYRCSFGRPGGRWELLRCDVTAIS